MATYIDQNGERQQIDLNGMTLYREAMAKGISFRQLVNQKYPTEAGRPETFKQMCAAAGLRFQKDEQTGVPAANLLEMLEPLPEAAGGSFINQAAIPDSRLLFPSAVLAAIENKLETREDEATNAFESLVGFRQTIATNKFEQPVLNYAGAKGPEDSRFQTMSQNTRPHLMLSITASDITRRIPTIGIGLEVSREAMMSSSLDFVAMTMARFIKKASFAAWTENLSLLLNGDPDGVVTSFSAGTSALATFTAKSLDSTIATAGTLTQDAYLKYLYKNSLSMRKTHLITDFSGAMSLENRANRPTNVQNNSTDRLDAPYTVIYPNFQEGIKVLVMPENSGWTANTIMGLDATAPAIGKVTSTFCEYQAIEDVVMARKSEMIVTHGWLLYKLYDEAFNVMNLTV